MDRTADFGWMRYVWLIYLCFLILQPIRQHAGFNGWLALALVTATFLYLYFSFPRKEGWRRGAVVAGIAVLGLLYIPFNSGATTVIVYAAAFLGFTVSFGTAIALLIVLIVATTVEMTLLHVPVEYEILLLVITAVIGLGNIYFSQNARTQARLRKADEEIKNLAKIAERERIARDLHDVLGHTLSMIVLKSELASKLIDSDPPAAAREIRDVESVSRKALAEVRQAIGGYRAVDLASELTRALDTLGTAGIDVQTEWMEVNVPSPHENVLALALREAVLNIVRHSHARSCRLRLFASNTACNLEVYDDGQGAKTPEGNGLRGMRERIEALGGVLQKKLDHGTVLMISLPLQSQQ